MKKIILVFTLISACLGFSAEENRLQFVADLNPGTQKISNPYYSDLTLFEGQLYMMGGVHQNDRMLWRGDRFSMQPIAPLKNEFGGVAESAKPYLLGERTVFYGPTGLWVTDGSFPGTQRLPASDQFFGEVQQVNNLLYFYTWSENTDVTTKFWESDGTPEGTRVRFERRGRIYSFHVVGQQVYMIQGQPFINTDASLMDLDGQNLQVLETEGQTYHDQIFIGDKWLFTTSVGTWAYDGTQVEQIYERRFDLNTHFHINGEDFFLVHKHGVEWSLIATDGTLAGTGLIKTFDTNHGWQKPVLAGDYAYIPLYFGSFILRTNGTQEGTTILELELPENEISFAVNYQDTLYFNTATSIWRLNGETAERVYQVSPATSPAEIRWLHAADQLYFEVTYADDTSALAYLEGGDAIKVPGTDRAPKSTYFKQMKHVGDHFYVTVGPEGTVGGDIYCVEGNRIQKVQETNSTWMQPTPNGLFTLNVRGSQRFLVFQNQAGLQRDVIEVDPEVYTAQPLGDGIVFRVGERLLYSDGSQDGLLELAEFESLGRIYSYGFLEGQRLFSVIVGEVAQLWETDGTVSGTRMLFATGIGEPVARLGAKLLFKEKTETVRKFTISDGSDAGTFQVFSLNVEDAWETVTTLGMGDYALVVQDKNLWYLDTEIDTARLLTAFPSGTYFQFGYHLGDGVGLIGIEDNGKTQLWRTMGTQWDTYPMMEIPFAYRHTLFAGKLWFSAENELGRELWQSDGTIPGTHLAVDIDEHGFFSDPGDFYAFGGKLFFSAYTRETGRELWSLCEAPELEIKVNALGVCNNDGIHRASVPPAGPGAQYTWVIEGGEIVTGANTHMIDFIPAASTVLSVTVTMDSGCEQTAQQQVSVTEQEPLSLGAISGINAICDQSDDEIFSVTQQAEVSYYEWTVPEEALILSGQGTHQILVRFGAMGGTIGVRGLNGCGYGPQSTHDVSLSLSPGAVSAGIDQDVCDVQTQLEGSVPEAGNEGHWEIISGIDGQITNPTSPNSTFVGIPFETYRLRWYISSPGCGTKSDDVVITFREQVPEADAGEDRVLCDLSTFLEGTPSVGGIGEWTIISGEGGTFQNSGNGLRFYGEQGVAYVLRWTFRAEGCEDVYDEISVQMFHLPITIDAGLDQNVVENGSAVLDGQFDTGWEGTWSVVSGPSTNLSQFSDIHDPQAVFTADGGLGVYRLKWTVSAGPCGSRFDEVSLTYNTSGRTPMLVKDSFGENVLTEMAISFNGFLYFAHNDQTWRVASGSNVASFVSENEPEAPHQYTISGGRLYFFDEKKVWRLNDDGTDVEMIADFAGYSRVEEMIDVNGTLYFTVRFFNAFLWRTDGTPEGTQQVAELDSLVSELAAVGDRVFYTSDFKLWVTDGTQEGTLALFDGYITEIMGAGNHLYFVFNDQLYASDGTVEGTVQVTSLTSSGEIRNMAAFSGQLIADVSDSGRRLYAVNGVNLRQIAGDLGSLTGVTEHALFYTDQFGVLHVITDIDQSGTEVYSESLGISDLVAHQGITYFVGDNLDHGAELWRTDLTSNGTYMVHDLAFGSLTSQPDIKGSVGDDLFFTALLDGAQTLYRLSPGTVTGRQISVQREACEPMLSASIPTDEPIVGVRWVASNIEVLDGQGGSEIRFRSTNGEDVILTAIVSFADGSSDVITQRVDIYNEGYSAWQQRELRYDLNSDYHVDIRDLIQLNDRCQ